MIEAAGPNVHQSELDMNVRLALFQDGVDNLRMAKQQQWNVAYYTVAVTAGIIGLYGSIHSANAAEAWLYTYSGVVLSAAASYFLLRYQTWMIKYRNRCVDLLQGLPPQQRAIWQRLGPNKKKGFFYGADFWGPLAAAGLVASFLVAWCISRNLASAFSALAAALAASVLIGLISFCHSKHGAIRESESLPDSQSREPTSKA